MYRGVRKFTVFVMKKKKLTGLRNSSSFSFHKKIFVKIYDLSA